MAFTLTASVGRMGGLNRTDDVRKVQIALNKVPATSGGPPKPLETTTGVCGPKTIEAIQLFQIKHFGWCGADGRVDVNGVTHQKLNEFDGPVGGTTVDPVGPTVDPVVTSESFSIRLDAPGDQKFLANEWRLMFTDEANETSCVYRVDSTGSSRPAVIKQWGSPYAWSLDEPGTPEDYHNALFAYSSRLNYRPNKWPLCLWICTMVLQPVGKPRRYFLDPPWVIADCFIKAMANADVAGTYAAEVMGQLKRIDAPKSVTQGRTRVLSEAERLHAQAGLLAKMRQV